MILGKSMMEIESDVKVYHTDSTSCTLYLFVSFLVYMTQSHSCFLSKWFRYFSIS